MSYAKAFFEEMTERVTYTKAKAQEAIERVRAYKETVTPAGYFTGAEVSGMLETLRAQQAGLLRYGGVPSVMEFGEEVKGIVHEYAEEIKGLAGIVGEQRLRVESLTDRMNRIRDELLASIGQLKEVKTGAELFAGLSMTTLLLGAGALVLGLLLARGSK